MCKFCNALKLASQYYINNFYYDKWGIIGIYGYDNPLIIIFYWTEKIPLNIIPEYLGEFKVVFKKQPFPPLGGI